MFSSFYNYLSYEKRVSKHTLVAYKKDLEQYQCFLVEQYQTDDVIASTHQHIRSWLVVLLQMGNSTRTIHRKLASLKAFFRFLQKRKKIDKDPTTKVIPPKSSKRLPEYVQEKQMNLLLEEVQFEEGYQGQLAKTIITLLYATGIRKSELINLKLQDINFEEAHISVLGKGNKTRLVPLIDFVVPLLEEYHKIRLEIQGTTTHFFLTKKGKPLYPKLVYNIVKKYLSLVTTLQQRGPHTLRHTFATHLSNNGAELNAIKTLLGHTSLATTQVYIHNDIEKLKQAYSKAHPKSQEKSD